MKAKTRHWFIYQQPCFRFHIFAIHLIGVRIMPLAGRDGFNTTNIKSDGSFQSTRPLRGATVAGGDTKCMAGDFNPRAPCGARRSRMLFPQICLPISIHAPLAGRDMRSVSAFSSCRLFQSTRPLRGATRFTICGLHHHTDFNPRAPCGARRQILERMRTWDNISIHAPREGRDCYHPLKAFVLGISIHAPREGRDLTFITFTSTTNNFNPRAPRGARLLIFFDFAAVRHFNPRAPRGARRRNPVRASRIEYFNPRAPRGARRLTLAGDAPAEAIFQSTRPARGATAKVNKFLRTFLQKRHGYQIFLRKTLPFKAFCRLQIGKNFSICGANRCGNFCELLLRTIRSSVLPEGRSACSQNAQFYSHTFSRDNRNADCLFPDP